MPTCWWNKRLAWLRDRQPTRCIAVVTVRSVSRNSLASCSARSIVRNASGVLPYASTNTLDSREGDRCTSAARSSNVHRLAGFSRSKSAARRTSARSGATLTQPEDLRGFGLDRFGELLRVESIFEVRGVLPAHLVEYVVGVEIDRGDGNVALWFRSCQDVRTEQDYVTGFHYLLSKLAEQERRTVTYNDHLDAVIRQRARGR